MIDYTKPRKINYTKIIEQQAAAQVFVPFVAPAGYVLRRGETINLSTRVVTRSM